MLTKRCLADGHNLANLRGRLEEILARSIILELVNQDLNDFILLLAVHY